MRPLISKLSGSFILLFLLTICTSVQGQEASEEAMELTRDYQYELNMTIDQSQEFLSLVDRYLGLREKARKNITDQKALQDQLQQLSQQETAAMGGILSSDQMKAYKKLKKKLQPAGR